MKLMNSFSSRSDLISYVKYLCPWAEGPASPIKGGAVAANEKLAGIHPENYARTRNYGAGSVTKLSPYIRHGILSLSRVRKKALELESDLSTIEKFIQELVWREFWQHIYWHHPEWIWHDIEDYKTGFQSEEYANVLPDDIKYGKTDVACLNDFIRQLITTGYIHNHARMYLAAYIVHWRHIKWQAGAEWFLTHLLDGDPASNNFSWQWVASTFSNRPYIFNLENVNKYFNGLVDTMPANNKTINASYADLSKRLFPRKIVVL